MAGLLTFPCLLAFPTMCLRECQWHFKQTLKKGITAAGTVPDSHRIPLHRDGNFV